MTAEQLNLLVEMVCGDHQIAYGRFQSDAGQKDKENFWQTVAMKCNLLVPSSQHKTVEMWKMVIKI